MLKRAILLSLFAHLAIAGGVLFFHPQRAKVQELIVEAPLGNVFVQEASMGESAPARANPSDQPRPAAQPDHAAPPGTGGDTSPTAAVPGLPDGEASPVGKIQPAYPPLSRRMNEEGEAIFSVEVQANGSVSALKLEKSSGHERLDTAAHSALKDAKFHPASKSGQPIASTKRMRIEFRLEAGKK